MPDIAAAFVLLVAGGCARAVVVPLFYYLRDHPDWWGEDFVKAEMREHEWVKAAMEDVNREAKHYFYKQYTGTKNAGKVPIYGDTRVFGKPCPEFDELRQAIIEQSTSIEEAQKRLRKAEEAAIRAGLEEDDDEVWMKIAMQSGASRSEAERRVERFHAMRNNSPRLED